MTQVKRQELERRISLDQASLIIDIFLSDETLYPYDDFLSRRGICKVLAEEYMPLVQLAKALPDVEGLQLFPASNEGPDAEVMFHNKSSWTAQITCAHESYQMALFREQLLRDGAAMSGIRQRDKSGRIVSGRSVFVADKEIEIRINRILSAIQAKEDNYHEGTSTLIVQEAPASAGYLQRRNLHAQVEALHQGQSNYDRIYVIYGMDVRQIMVTNLNG